MPITFHRWGRRLLVAIAIATPASLAVAQESTGRGVLSLGVPTKDVGALGVVGLSSVLLQEGESAQEQPEAMVVDSSESPFSFDLSYSIYSDYVFRGINLSEYAGEGREKPNHQLDFSMSVDIGLLVGQDSGTCGTFVFGTWFEWFAAQKKLNPVGGGQNLQEVDYYLSWSYDLDSIASTVSLGYTFYTLPNAKAGNTQEWSITLEHNDAWLWKSLWPDNEDGVLNPTFMLAHDLDASAGNAVWIELGLSHGFELCPDVTLTPSWTLGIDHNYYHTFAGDRDKHTTRFANIVWGLDLTYDLTNVIELPEGWGSMSLSGFLYFSDALGNVEDNRLIQDEFFGGMSIGWSF